VPASPSRYADDIALKARVTASSLSAGFNQALYKAIDGNTGRLQQRHCMSGRLRKVELGVGQVRAGRARRQAHASCRMAVQNLDDRITETFVEFEDGKRNGSCVVGQSWNGHDVAYQGEDSSQRHTEEYGVNPFAINVGLGETHDFWRGAP
jgi:hypothetical protein